jgi:hypothetical protein
MPRISTASARSFSIHVQTVARVTPISEAIFGPGTTTVAFFTNRWMSLSILRSVLPGTMGTMHIGRPDDPVIG